MSYALLLLYILVLCWIIWKGKFFQSTYYSRKIVVGIFLSKFFMGTLLVLIYQYYYGERGSGDVFKYFDDGNIIHSAIYEKPMDYLRMLTGIGSDSPHLIKYYDTCGFWFKDFNYGLINDNRIVIRFNALIRLISLRNIYIHTLFMSFVSFVGLWAILKSFEQKFSKQKYLLLLVVFFFPSVWFWTSGLLKEGILMGAFGLLYYLVSIKMVKSFSWKYVLGIMLCVGILLLSKFYVLLAAIPGLLCFLPSKRIAPYLKFLVIHGLCLLFVYFSEFFTGIDFIAVMEGKQFDFVNYVQSMQAVGSYIEIPDLEPNLWSFIRYAPQAFWNTLIRPSLMEANNPMMLMAALENLLILGALLISVFTFSKRELKQNYFLFSLSFVVILFVLSGLTTPVLGALVRYKAPALPFLGILFLAIADIEKLKTHWRKLRTIGKLKASHNE